MEVITVLLSLVVYILGKRTEQPEADMAQNERADMMNRLQDLLFSLWEKEADLYSKHANLKYSADGIRKEKEWWLSVWELEWKQYAEWELKRKQCAEAASQKESRVEELIQEQDRLELEKSLAFERRSLALERAQPVLEVFQTMLKRRRRLGRAQPLEATREELEQAAEWTEFKRTEEKWEKTKEELWKTKKELWSTENRLREEERKVRELKSKMKMKVFQLEQKKSFQWQKLGIHTPFSQVVGDQEIALKLLKTREDELEQRWLRMAPERLEVRGMKLKALELSIPLYGGKLEENSEIVRSLIKVERRRIGLGLEPEWFRVKFARLSFSSKNPLLWRAEALTSFSGKLPTEVSWVPGVRDSGFGDWEQKHNKSGIEIKWLEMDQKWLELEFEHQQLLGKDLQDPECVAEWQEMMQKWQEFVTELQETS